MVGSCPCTLAQRNLDIVYILDSSVSIPIEHWEEFTDGIADLVQIHFVLEKMWDLYVEFETPEICWEVFNWCDDVLKHKNDSEK